MRAKVAYARPRSFRMASSREKRRSWDVRPPERLLRAGRQLRRVERCARRRVAEHNGVVRPMAGRPGTAPRAPLPRGRRGRVSVVPHATSDVITCLTNCCAAVSRSSVSASASMSGGSAKADRAVCCLGLPATTGSAAPNLRRSPDPTDGTARVGDVPSSETARGARMHAARARLAAARRDVAAGGGRCWHPRM